MASRGKKNKKTKPTITSFHFFFPLTRATPLEVVEFSLHLVQLLNQFFLSLRLNTQHWRQTLFCNSATYDSSSMKINFDD